MAKTEKEIAKLERQQQSIREQMLVIFGNLVFVVNRRGWRPRRFGTALDPRQGFQDFGNHTSAFLITPNPDFAPTAIRVLSARYLTKPASNITHTRAEIFSGSTPLTWARDQSHIAFVSGLVDAQTISDYMALKSCNLKTLAQTPVAPAEIRMPQYSPSGAKLGYVRGSDLILEDVKTGQRNLLKSGVSHHYWCWGVNDFLVFYIRDGMLVCEYDLQSRSERILFSTPSAEEKFPSHVICSPDGLHLGYHIDDWFHTIDLASGKTEKHFKCDHYFIDFDWNDSGICYLDAVGGERQGKGRLMVYDPVDRKSSLVATGPFAYPRWVDASRILVRRGNTELWVYGVHDGKNERLFGASDEDE